MLSDRATGGEEPDEFVRHFETSSICHEAADYIEALETSLKQLLRIENI